MKYLDILYQIGFECQVATLMRQWYLTFLLYQIGFECQVATPVLSFLSLSKLYRIVFHLSFDRFVIY